MKIRLLLRPCSPALAERVAADADLARRLGARPNAAVGWLFPKPFDADGPVLERLLTHARGETVSFLRDVEWSDAELDAAPRLEVVTRVTAGQTRAEAEHTLAAYRATPVQPTHGRWAVRRPDTLYLSRALRGDTIAHVDQWTGEYVVGADVADALRTSGLTGFALGPVRQLRKPARTDAHHLVSDHTLPPAGFDATAWTDPDGTPRRYGSLVYADAALDGAADFARTAEPWGPWETPAWIVSPAVRAWVVASGWRGWGFRPVLVAGSAAHEAHRRGWQRVTDQLAAHGQASILA